MGQGFCFSLRDNTFFGITTIIPKNRGNGLFAEFLFTDKARDRRVNQANAFGNDDPACSGIGASDDQAEDQRNGTHHDHDYVFIRLPSTNQPYNTDNHQNQSNDDVQKCIKGSWIGNDPKADAKQGKDYYGLPPLEWVSRQLKA